MAYDTHAVPQHFNIFPLFFVHMSIDILSGYDQNMKGQNARGKVFPIISMADCCMSKFSYQKDKIPTQLLSISV
jgi:hypothetical protein